MKLRGAITYMTSRWGSFVRFFRIWFRFRFTIMIAKRAVKNPVVGKKAWLFFWRSHAEAKRPAAFYTLTATCRRTPYRPACVPEGSLRNAFPRIDVEKHG